MQARMACIFSFYCAFFVRAIPNKDSVPAQTPRLGNCIPTVALPQAGGLVLVSNIIFGALNIVTKKFNIT